MVKNKAIHSRQKYAFDSLLKKGGISGESRQNYEVLCIMILVISVFAMQGIKTKLLQCVLSPFNFTLLEKYSSE